MPAGSMLISAVNPDGTTIGISGGSVTVTNFPATQTVAGTVTANAGTGTFNVTSGSITSTTTLNAVTGNSTGVVADFGSAKGTISIIAQGTATLAGTLSVKISHNNTLFVEAAGVPITAAGVATAVIPAGARYARVDLTGSTGAGTITCTIMGA